MPNYLLLTPCGFYLRLRVPADLRVTLGKREIKKPLYTHDKKTASRLANHLVYNIEQQFNTLREPRMANNSPSPNFHGMIVKRRSGSEIDISIDEFIAMSEARARLLLDGDAVQTNVVEASPALMPASSEIVKTLPSSEPVSQPSTKKPILTLKKVVEKFTEEKSRNWAPGTVGGWSAFTTLLLEYFGDVPMSSITRDAANEFIDVLSYIPPTRRKSKFLGQTLQERSLVNKKLDLRLKKAVAAAVAAGDEFDINEYDGELPDCLDTATINGYLSRANSIWEWGFAQDRDLPNPFKSQRVPERAIDAEPVRPFTKADLECLFTHEIFTQHRMRHSDYFWIPIIGAYTGMRLNEIVQLFIEDILQEPATGIWYFNLHAKPPRTLKNKSSIRSVPLHPSIIDLGFLVYISDLQALGETRLFPRIRKVEKGPHSRSASLWFGRLTRALGLRTPTKKVVFHSFRHTFANGYAQMSPDNPAYLFCNEKTIGTILGHTHATITFKVYALADSLQKLKPAIDALDLDGFDPASVIKPWTHETSKTVRLSAIPQRPVGKRRKS